MFLNRRTREDCLSTYKGVSDLLRANALSSKTSRWGLDARRLASIGTKSPAAYYFELWVCITVARAIIERLGGPWELCSPNRVYAIWPLSPGEPHHFCYFRPGASNTLVPPALVIRPGVEAVPPALATTYAPDLSLRLAHPVNWKKELVIRMWDAKYRTSTNKGMTRSEVFTFAVMARGLTGKGAKGLWRQLTSLAAVRTLLTDVVWNSGLLTNGTWSTEPDKFLVKWAIVEAARCGTKSLKVRGASTITP